MLIVKSIDPAVLLDKMYVLLSSTVLVVLLVLLGSYLKAALQLKKGKGGMNGPITHNMLDHSRFGATFLAFNIVPSHTTRV